jgi:hypothetical protein
MAGKPNQVAPVKPVPTFAEYLSGFFWFLRPDEEASSCTRCDEQQAMARHERQQRQEAEQRADDARRHAQHARQRADGLDRKATQFEGKLAEAEAKLKLAADEHTATVAALTGTIGRLSKEIEDATASIFRVQQEPFPTPPSAGKVASSQNGSRRTSLRVAPLLVGLRPSWPERAGTVSLS